MGGFFEVEFLGGALHFFFQFQKHFAGFPLQKVTSEFYPGGVLAPGDLADARGRAILDDVIVTMLVVSFPGNSGATGAEAELFVHNRQGPAQCSGLGKRAKIATTVVFFEAGDVEAGIGFAEVDFDQEEAFIVAKADVVTGTIFLDQLAFQEDGFGIGADGVGFQIADAFEEGAGFAVGGLAAGGMEILRDPFAEVFGFSDVNNSFKPVLEKIDPRLVG